MRAVSCFPANFVSLISKFQRITDLSWTLLTCLETFCDDLFKELKNVLCVLSSSSFRLYFFYYAMYVLLLHCSRVPLNFDMLVVARSSKIDNR